MVNPNPETDFGWWNNFPGQFGSRLSWNETAGVLYLFHAQDNRIEILASAVDREEVDKALEGYEDHINDHDGLSWLRRRLSS